jgi:pimeloyl-ACP methyl ester carboxylesterase
MFEGRAALELASLPFWWPVLRRQPRGDGHPVLVLPGFLATSRSTAPLRWYLENRGYSAHRWRLGRNYGYDRRLHRAMADRLAEVARRHGRTVSLIGWSLGGVYARELAKEAPDLVRQVITLGSPFRGGARSSRVRKVYQLVTGEDPARIEDDFIRQLERPPDVPTTSIYTLTDSIVDWRASIERLAHERIENVGVHAAHFGLGVNPTSWIVIADRLAQPEGEWRPFEPGAYQRYLFSGIQNADRPEAPRGLRELVDRDNRATAAGRR